MGWLQFISLLILFSSGLSQGRSSTSGGKIKVLGPEYLVGKYHKTHFEHHISSFGRVPYGHSIVGNVRVPFPDHGCGADVRVDYDVNNPDPLILLVKRSNCTFLEKVQTGQKLKASMVIIVDNESENMDYVIPWAEHAETLNVHIPSVIIDDKSGNQLEQIAAKRPVTSITNKFEAFNVRLIKFLFEFLNDWLKGDQQGRKL